MYLNRVYIENIGPIKSLFLKLPSTVEGLPKPMVLVGANGGGKTNLLSIVADAIYEVCASHFKDTSPGMHFGSRPWFRIIGASTVTIGTQGGCSVLEFEHANQQHIFTERSGTLAAADVLNRMPASFQPTLNWSGVKAEKSVDVTEDQSKQIFESGAYAFLPSSRAEQPLWLNPESLHKETFDLSQKFNQRLGKPIYVERGLDKLKQWMSALLIDTRGDITVYGAGQVMVNNLPAVRENSQAWNALNQILKIILDRPAARFIWGGRLSQSRMLFTPDGAVALPFEALSAGQATLLNIFGTLMRYADGTVPGMPVPNVIQGICIVDEIDAHMHVDLQNRALPELVALFPKVQFILSSHPPLFALGMETKFGADGVLICDMPSGNPVQAEAYTEFGKALDVFRTTKKFNSALVETATAAEPDKLLVFTEGETDPQYLKTAAELLGYSDLLEKCSFQWIGTKTQLGVTNTGKNALNAAYSLFHAKPDLLVQPMLLLYDNDAQKPAQTIGKLSVRTLPTNAQNTKITAGIENLLSMDAFGLENIWEIKITDKGNGVSTATTFLKKSYLCQKICEEIRSVEMLTGFALVLDLIAAVVAEQWPAD